MQKISPCLWFDTQAEEAMNFYVEVFNGSPAKKENSSIISIMRYPDEPLDGPPAGFGGKVLTGIFELEGQRYMALDGGPLFKFTEAISLQIECVDQAEVDYFWDKLSAVPESEQCGWLKDKYGLSWQIIPKTLDELLNDPDTAKASRVLKAMLQMKKIDVAGLQKAAVQG